MGEKKDLSERTLGTGMAFSGMFAPQVSEMDTKEEKNIAPVKVNETTEVISEKIEKPAKPKNKAVLSEEIHSQNKTRRVVLLLQPALYDEIEKKISEEEKRTFTKIPMNAYVTKLILNDLKKGI